jgi:hypothetical protein
LFRISDLFFGPCSGFDSVPTHSVPRDSAQPSGEIPKLKSQISNKIQVAKSKLIVLALLSDFCVQPSFEFGLWYLGFVWDLSFGSWFFISALGDLHLIGTHVTSVYPGALELASVE